MIRHTHTNEIKQLNTTKTISWRYKLLKTCRMVAKTNRECVSRSWCHCLRTLRALQNLKGTEPTLNEGRECRATGDRSFKSHSNVGLLVSLCFFKFRPCLWDFEKDETKKEKHFDPQTFDKWCSVWFQNWRPQSMYDLSETRCQ